MFVLSLVLLLIVDMCWDWVLWKSDGAVYLISSTPRFVYLDSSFFFMVLIVNVDKC